MSMTYKETQKLAALTAWNNLLPLLGFYRNIHVFRYPEIYRGSFIAPAKTQYRILNLIIKSTISILIFLATLLAWNLTLPESF